MKKLLGILFLLCIVMLPIKVQAENYSGTCGDNISWTLTDGVLAISGSGDMTDYTYSNPAPWFEQRSSVEAVVFSGNITSIGDCAFYLCHRITSISLPSSVTEIGFEAFSDCWDLQRIDLPAGLTTIGKRAFSSCFDLAAINIPGTVVSIGDEAFTYCDFASVYIPAGVTEMGVKVFAWCPNLISIEVDAANTAYASEDGILMNKAKTSLRAYPRAKTATYYQIPGTVTDIGSYAFYGCDNLQTVVIPENVTTINSHAFSNMAELVNVIIPGSVSVIPEYAFAYCDKLSNIGFGEGITTLEDSAFTSCDSIVSLTLPNSVTTINWYVFGSCEGLKQVYIPANVSKLGSSVFYACDSLEVIKVDEANAWYSSDASGVLFNKDKTQLIQYPIGNAATYYEIPDGVEQLYSGAFDYAENIVDIIIPASVKYISTINYYHHENLAIYGYSDTAAEEYAENAGLPFYDLTIVYERFSDIPEVSWYTTSVQYVFDNGYMSGKKFNWFDATGNLTRAEFVTTLYKVAGAPAIGDVANVFSDVENAWYKTPVLWANSTGCVSGYGDGRFGVNDKITREQLALILYINGKDYGSAAKEDTLVGYKDASSISSYALEAMEWAVTNGIMSGTTEGNLMPQGNATRAECAVMLNKYCSLING